MAATGRATLRQVAEAVGLSPAAVSYALRGLQVSEQTQARVRAVAEELGYVVDPIGRALASGRTGTVGVLTASLQDLWQQQVAAGIGRALLSGDRYALIVDAGNDPDREQALARQLVGQRVDALVVSPVDPSAAVWKEVAASTPLVSVGDALPDAGTAGEVLFDNRTGVNVALAHLRRLGHRRLALLTPGRPSTPDRPAELQAETEGRRLGLRTTVVSTSHELPAATDAALAVLSDAQRPTAVFCLSDSIAFGVYAAAAQLGLGIPADLSVLGYDDQPVSALLHPPLTTFGWDTSALIRGVAGLVDCAVAGRRPRRRRLLLVPSLMPRESTGPLRRQP